MVEMKAEIQVKGATPMGNSAGGHLRGPVVLSSSGRCEGVERKGGGIVECNAVLQCQCELGCSAKLKSIHVYGGGRVKICGGWNARREAVFDCCIGNEGRGG